MAAGFLGGHSESYRAMVLNERDVELFALDLRDGSLDWNQFRDVKGSGSLTVSAAGLEGINWLVNRVAITYHAELGDQVIDEQLMVGIVSGVDPNPTERTLDLTILDKLSILSEDALPFSLGYPVGTLVTAAVVAMIQSTGETKIAIVESTETIRTALVFDVGEAKLTVVNRLLSTIDYSSLYVDGQGVFRSEPYVEPDKRDVMHRFEAGRYATFTDEIVDERDLFNIPNKVIAISTSDGETEALVATAQNDDPSSPYSVISRRGRVLTRVETGVAATSQETLQAFANRILQSSSQVTWRQTLQHLWAKIKLSDAVVAPNSLVFTVVEMVVTLQPGTLVKTVIRRMDTLGSGGE